MRKKYIAAVCVYRPGARESLHADVQTLCGQSWRGLNCPCSLKKIASQSHTVFEAELTCNEDGSNIRGVQFIRKLSDLQYRYYRPAA